jgi:signal transduction histidine kinase
MALDQLLRELLARLRKALQTDYATVLLLDEKRHVLNVVAHDGFRHEDVPASTVPVEGTISGRVASLGRALLFNRIPVPDAPEWKARYDTLGLRCAMGAPLLVEDRVIGVVSVASTSDRLFTDQDLALLQVVADRAAPTIERGRLVERVRAGRERLKALSRRLLTAEEEERRRVAVELHDDLGQVLTAAKINLESAERSSEVDAARSHLKEAIECVDQAMQRVRDLALDLRPSVLDDLGLAAALRWYVDRFAQKAHWEMHLSIAPIAKLEPAVETTCFRLAQEALTNVARHAQAAHVWFDLHLSGQEVELRVRDDGVGFDVPAARERAIGGASLGLLGMEERVSLAGGEFEILSAPDTGTEVRARFPVRST